MYLRENIWNILYNPPKVAFLNVTGGGDLEMVIK